MIIGSKHNLAKIEKDPIILIRENKVQRVRKTKSLGVIIDEKLDWKEHVEAISKKASKGIGALRLCKSFVPLNILQILYNALILPYFDYCCLVWNICSITLKTSLQKLQNRAARVITGDSYDIRSEQVLGKLGWKTLEERRGIKLTKYMSKVIEGGCPEILSNLFEKCNKEKYNLRSNGKLLRLSKPNTNSIKRSFSYKGAKVWNQQINKNN